VVLIFPEMGYSDPMIWDLLIRLLTCKYIPNYNTTHWGGEYYTVPPIDIPNNSPKRIHKHNRKD
jgi:hypothetical protein